MPACLLACSLAWCPCEGVSSGPLERSWNTCPSGRERLVNIPQTARVCVGERPAGGYRQGKSLKTNQFKKSHCSANHIVPNGCCPENCIKSSLNELQVVTTSPLVQDDPNTLYQFLLFFASISAPRGSLRGSLIS